MWRLSRTRLLTVPALLLHRLLFANSGATPRLNQTLCDFASHIIFGRPNDFGPCGSMGVFKNDKLIAAVVFHSWLPDYGIMEISAAATHPQWLTKTTIREIMANCFEIHGCQQLVSRMAVDNERAVKIYKFLGFTSVLLPNMRGRGKDEFLMLLTKEQWHAHTLNKG